MLGLSLFSGNGGIDLALKDYVHTIGYCEYDRYAQHLLASQMARGLLPVAPIYPDVRKLRGIQGYCDIIFGGFPCQDISVAGHGKGLAGERSGLFYEIVRLTEEIQPRFVFLENVPAIRTRGLDVVLKEFTELRYDCRWTVLSAQSVGAPHVRKRWFLLAHAQSKGLSGKGNRAEWVAQEESSTAVHDENLAYTESCNDSKDHTGQTKGQEPKPRESSGSRNVAYSQCNKVGIQSGWGPGSSRKDTPDYMDSSWWFSEPDVGRVVDGTPFRVDRVKSLGNGVVPLQVKTAFEKLMGFKALGKVEENV